MRLPPFELERYFAKYEFSVPFMLSASDCETLTIDQLLSLEPGSREKFLQVGLGYTESPGNPELREVVAGLYRSIGPDQVLIHTGAEEPIHNFMCSCLEAGDHMIAVWPSYQSLTQIASSLGCRVDKWRLRPDKNWRLDLSDLERMLTPRTKAVVINFPHNPTGAMCDSDFLHELADLSRIHGFIVFSDEVYRGLEHGLAASLPSFCDLDNRAVSLGVMSKAYGLPGLRIGWIATANRDVYQAMASYKDYTTICNPAPSEFLSILALRRREYILERIVGIIKRNLGLLDEFFEQRSDLFDWRSPTAGPIAMPRYLGPEGTDSFCKLLAEDGGVLLLPGSVYGAEFSEHFRIGFGRENLPQALLKMSRWLDSRRA